MHVKLSILVIGSSINLASNARWVGGQPLWSWSNH